MKYYVRVNGTEQELFLDGEDVRVGETSVRARLFESDGPERMLTLGDEIHRVFVRAGDARGRYTLNARARFANCRRRRRSHAAPRRSSRRCRE